MRLRTRLLALLLTVLALAGLGLTSALPAEAATKHVGIPNLTPYGGYLGNYLAPDGARVYCIDSALPWPSGTTSGPSTVGTLVTSWGAALPAAHLQKLNYVLLKHGQTDDPVQAAAVAAFVNAYTSGWARDLGAGYAAGAWYLNGNATVIKVYDAIWADAEANAIPTGTATLLIDPAAGTASVAATPPTATGTLTLSGAVRADTGEASFAVTAAEEIPIRGIPADDAREYTVSARVAFAAPTTAGPSLVLYTTAGQQRTIRGAGPGSFTFSAAAQDQVVQLDFAPVLTTTVEHATVELGQPLVDLVAVGLAEGSRPWRARADGVPVAVVAEGVLYGPFDVQPAQSDTVPAGAPVAARETLTLQNPGEYSTSATAIASQPGYYTWVWTIDAARQDAVGAASLPEGYLFVSPFGLPEETHFVQAPPPAQARLAKTGSEPQNAGVVAVALIGIGTLLTATSRGRRRVAR
ncbi:MAG: hypothetical protein JWR04_549 [Rhodoglobus sp.]|nr:hypothetical protein [Rhodoglobus sp.]